MLPVGSPATGDDFVDRERETAFILNTIKNDHVMLVAPRRFGKTSIMRKIERDLASRGQSCVFLEVESVNSPGEFITDLVTALVECEGASPGARISSALGKAFALVQEKIDEIETPGFRAKLRGRLRAEFSDDWHEKAKRVDEIFAGLTGPICIILDEFPVAIQNMEEDDARKFLQWFRRLRQVSPGRGSSSGARSASTTSSTTSAGPRSSTTSGGSPSAGSARVSRSPSSSASFKEKGGSILRRSGERFSTVWASPASPTSS